MYNGSIPIATKFPVPVDLDVFADGRREMKSVPEVALERCDVTRLCSRSFRHRKLTPPPRHNPDRSRDKQTKLAT